MRKTSKALPKYHLYKIYVSQSLEGGTWKQFQHVELVKSGPRLEMRRLQYMMKKDSSIANVRRWICSKLSLTEMIRKYDQDEGPLPNSNH